MKRSQLNDLDLQTDLEVEVHDRGIDISIIGASTFLYVVKKSDYWKIAEISATPRGLGLGTRMLEYALELADRSGAIIKLAVVPNTQDGEFQIREKYGWLSEQSEQEIAALSQREMKRLKCWYSSYGFIDDEAAKDDCMIRFPLNQAIVRKKG